MRSFNIIVLKNLTNTGRTQKEGMEREEEGGSGWGTHVYLWRINFDMWQNQYNIVKLKKLK